MSAILALYQRYNSAISPLYLRYISAISPHLSGEEPALFVPDAAGQPFDLGEVSFVSRCAFSRA